MAWILQARARARADSANYDNGNLIVQGDNLHALKALLPRYAGRVKCIYIDPPYNTGNEGWVYNDNVNSPEIQRWLHQVVGKEGETLDRHDRWLCMMYPRLVLLRQFLRDDGVIVIHIDENEYASLEKLLDEVFGEGNNLGTIVWDKRNPKGDATGVAQQHELVSLFCRNKSVFKQATNFVRPKENAEKMLAKVAQLIKREGGVTEDVRKEYREWIKQQDLTGGEAAYNQIDENGDVFQPVSMAWPNKKKAPEDYFIPLIHPATKKPCPVPERGWRNPPATMQELLKAGQIIFGLDETTQPRRKYLLKDNLFENVPSLLYYGGSDDAMLVDMKIPFETPKPVYVAQRLIQSVSQQNDIILDSFAGSGTTAHAVLKQNAEDGGSRRFILVEMDEHIAQNVTAERVRRVAQGYTNAKGEQVEGLGGGFQFCTLSKEPLFTAEGQIRSDVRFDELAEFVWFSETGTGYKPKSKSPLLGVHEGRAIYLLYNGILKDKSIDGGNVLTSPVLDVLPKSENAGLRVIYAAACRLGTPRLQREGIVFKQTPYSLENV